MPGGNLRAIRKRISSVKSTRQITRAMKMVSGAKLRRAEERINAFRPYADELMTQVRSLAARSEGLTHPLLEGGVETAPPLFVLITSDRGLCGAFNANVIKQMIYYGEDNHLDLSQAVFYTVGRKAAEQVARRKWTLLGKQTQCPEPPTPEFTGAIVDTLVDAFRQGAVSSVTLVYNQFVNALSQKVTFQPLLPLPLTPQAGASRVEYLAEPEAQQLFDVLLPQAVSAQVERALLDNLAGEHGARMAAMDAASSNASDMIEKLTLNYNRARQAAITSELLDIVNGANAVE